MRDAGERLGLDIHVYGPELHMTSIVAMALGLKQPDPTTLEESFVTNLMATTSSGSVSPTARRSKSGVSAAAVQNAISNQQQGVGAADFKPLFTKNTRALFFGMQPRACQGMLDFDFSCKRERASVAGMIYPFSGNHSQKFYWGTKEVLVPVYQKMEEAMAKNPDVDVLINFASLRSAYDTRKLADEERRADREARDRVAAKREQFEARTAAADQKIVASTSAVKRALSSAVGWASRWAHSCER